VPLKYSKGDIVIVNYPFGPHPSYVVYDGGDDDVVVCMITSTRRSGPEEVEIPSGEGNIRHTSYVRPHKISTIPKKIVGAHKIGTVSELFRKSVDLKLMTLFGLTP
jgi:mRNA-degrading endonuclease toxin of MazEF toxin-antitoxin module